MINFTVIQNALGFIFNKKRFAVYDEFDNEVLSGMSVLNYNVNNDSSFIEHPIESGATIADHHVFKPVEINCKVAMPPKGKYQDAFSLSDMLYGRAETFENTFKQLTNLYYNSKPLRIKTDANVYTNMYLTSVPSDVSADTADRQIFYLSFKEAITVQPQYVKMPVKKVKNASNASFVKTGEVGPTASQESLLVSVKNFFTGK